jgi:hypothetical protein
MKAWSRVVWLVIILVAVGAGSAWAQAVKPKQLSNAERITAVSPSSTSRPLPRILFKNTFLRIV